MKRIKLKKGKQYILPRTICLLVICAVFFGLYSLVSVVIGAFADKPEFTTPTLEATAEPTEAPELVINYEFHGRDGSAEAHNFGSMMPKRVKNYSQADVEALASLCMAEASCCPEWEKRGVIDTVLNRVDDPSQFRKDILSECHSGEFNAGDDTWTKEIMLLVLDELEDWSYGKELTLPENYTYFWGNHGNSFDSGWHNYFYNDYAVWETEAHVSTAHAYEWR